MERSADECSEFQDAVYIQSRSENSLVHLTVLEAAMTVVDCTAPLNRYTCYGAIEVVAIIIIIIIYQQPVVQMTSCEGCLLFTFVNEN